MTEDNVLDIKQGRHLLLHPDLSPNRNPSLSPNPNPSPALTLTL